jgi:phosphonate transport system substrate-binding protein
MVETEQFTFAFAPTLAGGTASSADYGEPFRQYLSVTLDRPVRLVMPASYQETLDALRTNRADAAMVGDYVSRHAQAAGGVEQLVAQVSPDQQVSTYRSAFVTLIDSGIREMAMLRGTTLGLVDGQSTSGYLVPRAMLREADLDPDRDLAIRLFDSHRGVVEAVIAGVVDAGAAHESRLRPENLEQGPDYARLRILAQSRPIPKGPLVVRSTLDPETRRRLSDAMLRIHEADPAAAAIMLRQGHRFTLAAGRSNPTLKSIAALAGVSYATVSRVINSSGYVAPRTAERVKAIIDELGYAPNGHARVLLGRQSPLVGMAISLQSRGALQRLAPIIESVRAELERLCVPFVLCPIGDDLSGSPFADLLRDKRLGALIVGEEFAADPQIAALARTGHSIIVMGDKGVLPGIVASSADVIVRDVLNAIGSDRTGG